MGEGQWRDPKAMAVGPGHGTAGDGRKSEARHAAMTACGRAILAFDYASGDGCGFS